MTTEEFILEHRMDDVRRLALQGGHYPDVDMQYALQQIDGWQRARKKLPMWAATDGIIYPPHISMEQCSSEMTAKYKSGPLLTSPRGGKHFSSLSPSGEMKGGLGVTLIDLTGGFGVDFSYMSRGFKHAVYVEKQKHLCEIAKHNFRALGLDNVEVVCADAEEYLDKLQNSTLYTLHSTLYLDPARRDTNGHKTYAIEDCTPDVCKLMPRLRKIADRIIIKLSPMLDHREAQRKLEMPMDIHIVSVGNECKEILLDIRDDAEGKVFCVNDDNVLAWSASGRQISHSSIFQGYESLATILHASGMFLIVPNASIMKAGCFGEFAERYNLQALDNNSHLFIGEKQVEYPIARSFKIESVCTLNKKELKEALKDITQANIACRNFPMTPQELRKRLKLKDGGDKYIFGTTLNDKHVLIICKK